MPGSLPTPQVAPALYDEDYYLNWCAGYDEWGDSGGAGMAARYPGYLALIGLKEGETVVDIGCGRGELLVCASQRGARAVGVEYSPAAVALTERTFAAHGRPATATVVEADARAIPLADGIADVVTLLDVIEHLTAREQSVALGEAFRILRPGGRILVHTMPNRLVYDVTYRLQRLSRPSRRRRWPRDPRNDYERAMHVGEQTAGTLRRRLGRAGFTTTAVRYGGMIYTDFVHDEGAHTLYHRLAAHRLTRPLGRFELFAQATRPGTS